MTLILERVTRTAVFGVRFWDRVSGRPVTDGLDLVETGSGIHARSGPSGVFAFHDLPGLRDDAFGAGDDPFWASPPERAPFTFLVSDGERRFLPFTFTADAPVRGLFEDDCGVPESPKQPVADSVPLYSAPSRRVPGAVACVRADLRDPVADEPAAWAVLEAAAPGTPRYRGVADDKGRVVVLFPYPEPPWHGSSPPPGSRALSDQTWQLTLTVRYSPATASPPFPDPASGVPPDLCAVLTQPEATLLAAAPSTPLGAQTLAFGRELVLRTTGRSDLLVLPA